MVRELGEDVKCGKVVLPSGSFIVLSPKSTHNIEHIYPEPSKFIPERFLAENIEKRNPYAFIPFAGEFSVICESSYVDIPLIQKKGGKRNCIGYKFAYYEMMTVISKILRSFILRPAPGKETIKPLFRITLRASGGVHIKFVPRNNN